MKGIVFTEFMDLVENEFGYEMVDRIILDSKVPSNGAYTSIGTYPFAEIVKLMRHLSRNTNIQTDELLYMYGRHFFSVLLKSYPHFIERLDSAFQFFESVDRYIHVEVKKHYPDVELPRFKTRRLHENQLEIIYTSDYKIANFAQGLIDSSMEYYGKKGSIEKSILNNKGTTVRFLITI